MNSKTFWSNTIISAMRAWQQLQPGSKLEFMGGAVTLERTSAATQHSPVAFKVSFLWGLSVAWFSYNEIESMIDKLPERLNENNN